MLNQTTTKQQDPDNLAHDGQHGGKYRIVQKPQIQKVSVAL